jgi:hypothetical protein
VGHGQAGIPAPVRTSDFKGGFIGDEFLIHHEGYGQNPGTPADYFVGIKKTILAEGPQAGPGRSHPMRQMKRHLGVDPVNLKKTAKGFDSFGETVFGDPIIVQIAAAEMTFQRGREGLIKIDLH